MTVRLYDTDAYLKEFTATVESCVKCENGFKVILNKTAFFPEEGGQYSDRGTLGNSDVFDVQIENGDIVHYCTAPLQGEVKGTIEWDRRFRNMQNHTGEHIISGFIHTLFGGENVGFHLGEDEVTCDYDIELSEEQLKEVEYEVTKAIYKNLPVTAYYPSIEQLEHLNYRSKGGIDGQVRIVNIESVDSCACCAPHVNYTGEVGIIKILSSMRLRGGVRLFIACGLDAFKDYSLKHSQIKAISALLAAKPEECALGVHRLTDNLKAASHTINTLSSLIAQKEIEGIEESDCDTVIFTEKWDAKTLRQLVNKVKEKSGNICAAFSGNDNTGYSYIIYSDTESLHEKAKDISEKLGGRGGGKSPMIQGSITASKDAVKKYFLAARFIEL